MITREGVRDEILKVNNPNILCELPTSFGKTKIALELLKSRVQCSSKPHILIVIPRLVLVENWKAEFRKWKMKEYLPYVEFVTYVSFPKKAGNWDICIFDEAHHLSQRCRDSLEYFSIKYTILLSATVGKEFKESLKWLFKNLYIYRVSTKQAIKEEVLPDPKVYLIPMYLDNTKIEYTIVKNKSQKKEITIPYSDRFKYTGVKSVRINIQCTQKQYYDDMSSLIEWYKKKTFNETFKNMFLRKSGERLKWLSEQKTSFILTLLDKLKDYRTLTFCSSILQTEVLGKYCVNSSNDAAVRNLHDFNAEKINHITACNMLDEGANLTNCKVGVYASLNSSERMIKQKLGRLLRHSEPVIIIPYYKYTRDEEIVNKMLEDYNPQLVLTTNINELQL